MNRNSPFLRMMRNQGKSGKPTAPKDAAPTHEGRGPSLHTTADHGDPGHKGIASASRHLELTVDLGAMLKHLVEVADALWKADTRWCKADPATHDGPLKHLGRNLDSGLLALHAAGFEIKDHTEDRYVEGSRYEVMAFQPVDGMVYPTVIETIKPTIYFMERLIRPGQVIVGKPAEVINSEEA